MIKLEAKIRKKEKTNNALRQEGYVPAILYGRGIKNENIYVEEKELKDAYSKAGESSLIKLVLGDKEIEVLIHDTQKDGVFGNFIHVDFYHPSKTKKTETKVPLKFVGIAPAVKELGGILVKEISEIEVKGFVQDLPSEIEVNVENLKTFDDRIYIKDLNVSKNVEILKDEDEIVAVVKPPEEEAEEEIKEEEGEKKETEKSE